MRSLRAWLVGLAAIFGASRHDREFGEELESDDGSRQLIV
jgi:hypothetical protein